MAMVASSFVQPLVDRLVSLLEDEAATLLGAKGELKKLKKRLETMKDVIKDAEGKEIRDTATRSWLEELRQVMFEADDLIDDYKNEILNKARQRFLDSSLSWLSGVWFLRDGGKKVRRITARLQVISRERSELQLVPSGGLPEAWSPFGADGKNWRETWTWRETSSVVLKSEIVGIDDDAERLVRALMSLENGARIPAILAIMGMGGIGKTTLAQMVYNDDQISAHFDVKMWVCISRDFNGADLLKRILRLAGGRCGEAQTRAELDPQIRSLLQKKRFLLVLDDVWTELVWDGLLRSALQDVSAGGSRILVTTRNEQVAKKMGAVHCHRMSLLSNENCWSLLCNTVFWEGSDEEEIKAVKDIGMKIIEKCDNLPLAIKTIGDDLRAKNCSVEEWERVKNNQRWTLTGLPEGIASSLYLSYEDLPAPLKQCFVFCSLFPVNFEMHQSDLIQMWIAEGFVKARSGAELEDVAEEYYWELVGRGLLQPLPQYYSRKVCTMHDLFRSLAILLVKNEQFSGDIQHLEMVGSPPRHLAVFNEIVTIPTMMRQGLERLRTLLLFGSSPLNGVLLTDILRKLRHLRVLDLCGTRIGDLPSSVGKLVHLRMLRLSFTYIRCLPGSICDLQSLRALYLDHCNFLNMLPKAILLLNNLSHLSLRGTPLHYMPRGFGRLRNLTTLDGFVVGLGNESKGNQHACVVDELQHLSKLRCIHVTNLESVSSVADARNAELWNKSELKCLKLSCNANACGRRLEEVAIKTIEEVFEELCPPRCLKELTLESFYGRKIPSWISGDTLPYLKILLLDCKLSEQLPSLGKMSQLGVLHVRMPSIVTIKLDFFDGTKEFPKLEKLFFKEMLNWKEWQDGGEAALPCLRMLALQHCPRLRSLPSQLQHATVLTELYLDRAKSLMVIENLFSIKKVHIVDMPNLVRISNLPILETMKIIECSAVKELDKLGALNRLELSSRETETLPNWLQRVHSLQILYVVGKKSLIQRCHRGGEDWTKIRHIRHVTFKPI